MNLGKENENQEFKESLAQLDKGLKSLTAMLNRKGKGTVYFGVNDNGDVIGASVGKRTFEDIRNKIKDMIDPKIIFDINVEKDEYNKEYIKLYAEGSNIPYSFDGRYYVRNVASDEKVTNDLLRKMLMASDSDLIRNMSSERQDLTFNGFCNFLASLGQYAPQKKEFYISKGLLNKEDKFNYLAYLMSDQSDVSIKVVQFEGKDKNAMSYRTEFGKKCLLQTVNDVLQYFNSFNTTAVVLSGEIRKEQSLFDKEAFKEAWVNACLHNSWSSMVPPTVFIFDDRIEILSYGGLPYGLTLDSFFAGLSKPVNISLLGIFNSAKFSEQSGHGVPKIVNSYSKDAFSFNDGTVKVTIKFSFVPDFVKFRIAKTNKLESLTINQKNVYYFLKENATITLQEIADSLKISLAGVKKIVLKLQELDLLERKGSKKDGFWVIK